MATSGTFTGARGGSGTGPYLKLAWSRIDIDEANNKSLIRLTLSLVADYSINFSASKTGDLEGTAFTYTAGMSGTGTKTLKTLDKWYTHNSDGSLTTTLSGSFDINISWGGSTVSTLSVSGSATIDAIPRASDFTAFTLTNTVLNTNTAVTVNYTLARKSTAFSQDMTLKYGSTVIKSWNTTGTGALTQALSTTEVNNIINAMSTVTSGTLTLTMQTKSGSTNIGSLASRTLTVTLNAAIAPTASALAVSISGTGRDKTLGLYVQLISKVTASFTRTAGYGTTISSSTIIIKRQSDNGDSQTIASNSGTTANAVKLSGTYSVTATVTDGRGRTATVSTTITVTAYAAPTITSFTTSRDAVTTTNVLGTISASFSMGVNNPTDVTVVGVDRVGVSTALYTLNDTTTSPINLSQTYASQSDASSYTYTLTITDSFGNKATATAKVSTTFVEFTIAKGMGIGAGKVWERGVLDVGGRTFIKGNGGTFLSVTDDSYVAGTTGMYNYWGFTDSAGAYKAYIGFNSARDNVFNINNTIGDIKLTPMSGKKIYMMNEVDMNNSNLSNVNHIQIADSGGSEGLEWVDATNNWKIVSSPDDGSNASGPLQFFRNGVRMMTLGTTGTLYLAQNGLYMQGGGTIEAGSNSVNGMISHDSGYLTIGSYSVASYGSGYARVWWNQNAKQLNLVDSSNALAYLKCSGAGTGSDEDYKTNIEKYDDSALDKINATSVYKYHLKSELEIVEGEELVGYKNPEDVEKYVGLMWQEAPDDIKDDDGDHKTIDHYSTMILMWKSIQELSAEVTDLKKQLARK